MKTNEQLWAMIARVKVLMNYDIGTLRKIALGFHCDFPPSNAECKRQLGHQTRGELVEYILCHEFDAQLKDDSND